MVSPTENPALNFFQGAKGHFKFNASILPIPNFLAGVPISFTDKAGCKGVESNFDQVLPSTRKTPNPPLSSFSAEKPRGRSKIFLSMWVSGFAGEQMCGFARAVDRERGGTMRYRYLQDGRGGHCVSQEQKLSEVDRKMRFLGVGRWLVPRGEKLPGRQPMRR